MEDIEMKDETPAQIVEEKKEEINQNETEKEQTEAPKEKIKKTITKPKRNPMEKTLDDTLKIIQNLLKTEVKIKKIRIN